MAVNTEDHKGGETWCYCFIKHHGLCMCTNTKLAQPLEYEENVFVTVILQFFKRSDTSVWFLA